MPVSGNLLPCCLPIDGRALITIHTILTLPMTNLIGLLTLCMLCSSREIADAAGCLFYNAIVSIFLAIGFMCFVFFAMVVNHYGTMDPGERFLIFCGLAGFTFYLLYLSCAVLTVINDAKKEEYQYRLFPNHGYTSNNSPYGHQQYRNHPQQQRGFSRGDEASLSRGPRIGGWFFSGQKIGGSRAAGYRIGEYQQNRESENHI